MYLFNYLYFISQSLSLSLHRHCIQSQKLYVTNNRKHHLVKNNITRTWAVIDSPSSGQRGERHGMPALQEFHVLREVTIVC